MDEQAFWYIIAGSMEGTADIDAQLVKLKQMLENMTDQDLIAFQEMLDHMMAQAYTWDLFGAAYIVLGGCSDESFEHFRAGLIMRGKEVYEAGVIEPDSLADAGETFECPDLLVLACEVYEERNGDGAIYDRFREDNPPMLSGDSIDEHDEHYMRREYPRLWDMYCQEEA
jgi:hypothetical protein